MVVERFETWQEVFEQIERMSAGGIIQGFILEYEPRSPELRGLLRRTRFFPIASHKDVKCYIDVLPRWFTWLDHFDLSREPDDHEFVGSIFRKILLIRGYAQ